MLGSQIYIEGLGVIEITFWFDSTIKQDDKLGIYTPIVNNMKIEAYETAKQLMEMQKWIPILKRLKKQLIQLII